MFLDQIKAGIVQAGHIAGVDKVVPLAWRGVVEGYIAAADAEAVSVAAEARRQALRIPMGGAAPKPPRGARRPPRSSDRQRSLERRRSLATSGAVPARIACYFTVSETA